HQLRKLQYGGERKILELGIGRWLGPVGNRLSASRTRRLNRLLSGKRRMERDRRLGVERDLDLTQCLVVGEVTVDSIERHSFLRVGELEADQLFRSVLHVLRHALRHRWLLLLLYQTWDREACRNYLNERPPVHVTDWLLFHW